MWLNILSIINVVLTCSWDGWACFWHASASVRGRIFVRCLALIDARCSRVPQVEGHRRSRRLGRPDRPCSRMRIGDPSNCSLRWHRSLRLNPSAGAEWFVGLWRTFPVRNWTGCVQHSASRARCRTLPMQIWTVRVWNLVSWHCENRELRLQRAVGAETLHGRGVRFRVPVGVDFPSLSN
jgi:hypothetical protein